MSEYLAPAWVVSALELKSRHDTFSACGDLRVFSPTLGLEKGKVMLDLGSLALHQSSESQASH